MIVERQMEKWDSKNGIFDYLQKMGVQNPDLYLAAGKDELEDPNRYLNIDIAAARLETAIENREKVIILVDPDNDGLCSAAICYDFLRRHGLNATPIFHYVPKAHGMRYGTTENLITEILSYSPNLLIIPDASADVQSCAELFQNGISILIIDHHVYDFSNNPYATIVNCLQQDNTNHAASGTLVMQKVIDRYCEMYGENQIQNDDLVAMSLASDVMSMVPIENRAYMNLAMNECGGVKYE